MAWPFMQVTASSSPLQGPADPRQLETIQSLLPISWYLVMGALALLMPIGLMLVSVANLASQQARDALLGGLAAMALAAVGYWAIGFALQFGGIGLVYDEPQLRGLVWEWSALSAQWGVGWGMAGLSGWFLSGADVSALAYALFLAHLPWTMTVAMLPVVALRNRAPMLITLLMSLIIGAIVYPIVGNWVHGGGWLSALGRNVELGHGFVDFGGAGSVHLMIGMFGLAALVAWVPRREPRPLNEAELPPERQPLLALLGAIFILVGVNGWLWANPLQMRTLSDVDILRGAVNSVFFAGGGLLIPLVYTWFVTGQSAAVVSARGLAAGAVAGLAAGPFVQPGHAFIIGLIAGATVPVVMFLVDNVLRLDDQTGVVQISVLPAIIGLLFTSIFADGVAGAGWQLTGIDRYLGVTGQGVTGLMAAPGFQVDFPGQLQAQMIGVVALGLWGLLTGMLVSIPLSLLVHGFERSANGSAADYSTDEAGIFEPEPGLTRLHDINLGSFEAGMERTTAPHRQLQEPLPRRFPPPSPTGSQGEPSRAPEEQIEPFRRQ